VFGVRGGPVITENTTKTPPAHVCSERGRGCLLIIPILIAPHLHPTSSCLWQQLGVLWWCWQGLLSCQLPLLVIPILVAPHFHPMSSCSWQQLGVLSWWRRFSGVIGIGIGMCHHRHHHSPSPPLPIAAAACCRPTHDPPCKQLLVRLGAGGVLSITWCHFCGHHLGSLGPSR